MYRLDLPWLSRYTCAVLTQVDHCEAAIRHKADDGPTFGDRGSDLYIDLDRPNRSRSMLGGTYRKPCLPVPELNAAANDTYCAQDAPRVPMSVVSWLVHLAGGLLPRLLCSKLMSNTMSWTQKQKLEATISTVPMPTSD